MPRLDGRIGFITGAGRGMGASHARAFAREGARVVIADVLDEPGEQLAAELGPPAIFVHLDVTDEASWRAALEAATTRVGVPNVLVNNAGINSSTKNVMAELDLAEFESILDVNLRGPFLGMKVVGAAMAAAGAGGSIVNISSVGGLHGTVGSAGYIASKWGVRGLSKVAAHEYAPAGIRVNTVFPGLVETPMIAGDHTAQQIGIGYGLLNRIGRSEEISAVVVFLASDESSFCTGAEFVVDGGRTTK